MGSVSVKDVRSQVTKGLECPTKEGITEEHGLTLRLEDPFLIIPQDTSPLRNHRRDQCPFPQPSEVVLPNTKHTIHLYSLITDMHVDRI